MKLATHDVDDNNFVKHSQRVRPFFNVLIYPNILISCDKVRIDGILITISDSS